MSEPSDVNPYAPPTADLDAPAVRGKRKRRRRGKGIEEALEHLREHLADPSAVAYDKRVAGPRVRPAGLISAAICALATALAVAGSNDAAALAFGSVVAVVAGIFALIVIGMDLSLVPRDRPSSPEATLRAFLKSISTGRLGYAWAALCPTAREQTVSTPDLAPVETTEGDFTLASESELKAYVGSFARAGQSKIRTMAIKHVILNRIEGDVAKVDVELTFQSWPQWVSIVIGLGFVIFRPLVLVGAVLLYTMRKKRVTRCTKTMLRAENGVWYVYDGDLLEGAES